MGKTIVVTLALIFAGTACGDVPAIPATPVAVDGLVSVRPFILETGYTFAWRKEKPLLTKGMLLVLKVAPALVYPRQMAQPVLYVGDTTAERLNVGYESGHVIAVVPGEVDLTKAPIWFGTPELPERVDAKMIAKERAIAEEAGIKPFRAEQVAAARTKGGAPLEVPDVERLLRPVAALVREYSPAERDLAESMELTASSK